MTEQPGLDLSPFSFAGGPVGCLLIHGFTGSPPEMRPMGEYLAGQGMTVLGVRLPGHGTTVEDMIRTRWQDWAGEAERGLRELQERCRQVFVGGLSMGGLLTLYLGERHAVAGLLPMAAAVQTTNPLLRWTGILKYVVRSWRKAPPEQGDWVDKAAIALHWSYNYYPLGPAYELYKLMGQVRPYLARVTAPILIMQGTRDRSVPPASAQWLYQRVGSQDKELFLLHNSGHCLTVDAERELAWRKAYEFIAAHSG